MMAPVKDLVVGSKVSATRYLGDVPRFTEGEVIGIVYRPFKFGVMQKDFKVLFEGGLVVVCERLDLNVSW